MAVPYSCPNCGHIGKADEKLIGRIVKCPKCNHSVEISEPEKFVTQSTRSKPSRPQWLPLVAASVVAATLSALVTRNMVLTTVEQEMISIKRDRDQALEKLQLNQSRLQESLDAVPAKNLEIAQLTKQVNEYSAAIKETIENRLQDSENTSSLLKASIGALDPLERGQLSAIIGKIENGSQLNSRELVKLLDLCGEPVREFVQGHLAELGDADGNRVLSIIGEQKR